MTEGISPEEQAEMERLVRAVDAALDGVTVNMCLSVLSAVAAHICAEWDDPNEAGLSFTREFLEYLDDNIQQIPAERVVTIPAPPDKN